MPDYGAMASELLNQPVSSADARGLFSALFDLLRPEYTKEPEVKDVPAGTVGKVPQNQIDPLMAGTGAAVDFASMLTPAGAAKLAPGALAIFAGPMAKTADRVALAQAEKLAAKGALPEEILAKTGWFQGADKKWRFEIADNEAKIAPRVVDEFNKRSVGDQVPVQNADRFMDHPALFEAYPDLWRVNTRLKVGGGYPYTPHAHYFVRESGTEGIGLDADTLGRARSLNLHELQHAVQRREGVPFGANLDEVGQDAYRKNSGEVEAYNTQRRMDMTPEQRKRLPPWKTQDVPFDEQIVDFSQLLKAFGGAQ